MSAEVQERPARRIAEAHVPRLGGGTDRDVPPAKRLAARLALSLPFVIVAALVVTSGRLMTATPNDTFALRASGIAWDRADPAWVAQLYPPITTVVAALVPGGELGMTVVGALVTGFLLHALIEGMRRRGAAVSTTILFTVALAANPLFAFAATENLPAFIGIGLFGLGFADLVRFTVHRDTQSGFRAGILLMLAALSDPSGIVYVVVATLAAPLLSSGRGTRVARGSSNTLVVLFPSLCAFGIVFLLDWVFLGTPTALFAGMVEWDPARLVIFSSIFATPLGWLWLASMGGTWVIALVTNRPGAVVLTAMLFAAEVVGYLFGLVPVTPPARST